jgi:hypothetical protein
MAVTFTREFYTNGILFIVALVALVLSILAFVKPCKNDSFRNTDDLPPYDEKASTVIKLHVNEHGNEHGNIFATGVSSGKPSISQKENAQSLLQLDKDSKCLQCVQYKKGELLSYLYDYCLDDCYNDSIIDDLNKKLPPNNLINLALDDITYTSDLPCDTLTRLRIPQC